MIKKAIQYIINAINIDFEDPEIINEPQVVLGNIAFIDAFQDVSAQSTNDKLIASVVNIAQEKTLRNIPYSRSAVSENGTPIATQRSPEIWLNIYILFGANRTSYADALGSIGKIIGFFQRKNVFTPAELQSILGDTEEVDLPNVLKLIFDLHSMSFEELNQLWGIMGGKYIPSVLYKMRMAVIQEAETTSGRPIEAMGASPNKF